MHVVEVLIIGSRGPTNGTPKNQPATKTIRRIQGSTPWFVPETDLQGAAEKFQAGLIVNPVFNPRAKVMKDVFCGTDRVSEAEVTGFVVPFGTESHIPSDARETAVVGYDSRKKRFYRKNDPEKVIETADYVVLNNDGTSVACWK